MKSTDEAAELLLAAYRAKQRRWVRIAEVAQDAGLTAEEVHRGIERLMDDPAFAAEPEPFRPRITAEDKEWGPMIGGEQRHKISHYGDWL